MEALMPLLTHSVALVVGTILGLPLYRYLQKRDAEQLEALAKKLKALGEKV